MPDNITTARLSRTITDLQRIARALEGEHDTTKQLQDLTAATLDLAAAVRTIAARNP